MLDSCAQGVLGPSEPTNLHGYYLVGTQSCQQTARGFLVQWGMEMDYRPGAVMGVGPPQLVTHTPLSSLF